MKIYINNLNLNILNELSNNFKSLLIDKKQYIILYTEEGIYEINNKLIYRLEQIDRDIKQYENFYNEFTLIIDPSFFNKHIETSIIGTKHISNQIVKYIYKLNKKSDLNLIIEYNSNDSKMIENDIYFELNKEIDIDEIFIKKELIEFLSLLN